MITDIVDDGDGDVRSDRMPKLPLVPLGRTEERRARIIRHVQLAMRDGLSMPDALHGTGVSAKTVRRWLAEGSSK